MGWFDEITLLIWGACKHCAEQSSIVEELKSCGVEVFYTGEIFIKSVSIFYK